MLAGCAVPRSQPSTTPAPTTPDETTDEVSVETAEARPTERELGADQPAVEVLPDPESDAGFQSDPVTVSPLDDLAEAEPEPKKKKKKKTPVVVVKEPTYDIPIEVNDRVRGWIDRYSRQHKTSFEAGLRRSGLYLERFREIFAEEGIPQDLVYMAHVESGYKTSAYSRAHARGVFQFIAATGRRYDLRIDYWTDERSDPELSARAAARYMSDLYDEFGDWYLALAAYNAGEGKIRRAIARSGKHDFWAIARTNYIRRETKNHIPAIIAATILSKEPEKYGLTYDPEPALEYDTITVEGAADLRVLARCAGTDVGTLRALNPALRRNQTPPDGRSNVYVPLGSGPAAYAALQEIPRGERVLYARHRVRQGDTLSEISRHYGVGVRAIQDANGMGRRTMIRVNQTLLVPTSSADRYSDVVMASNTVPGEPLSYRVRRGDTLYAIGRRHGTTAKSIAAASGISVNKTLSIGERLVVVPGVRSSSEARRIATGGTVQVQSNGSGPRVHTVRRGDTLWQIASLYKTSVNMLCSLNDISQNATLYPGATLTVGYN
jgi:membrane-bound lytic murein transglycosylase D